MHQSGSLANSSTAVASMPSSSTDAAGATVASGAGGGGKGGGGKTKAAPKKAAQTMRKQANTKLTAVAGKFTELRVLAGEVQVSQKLLLAGMLRTLLHLCSSTPCSST